MLSGAASGHHGLSLADFITILQNLIFGTHSGAAPLQALRELGVLEPLTRLSSPRIMIGAKSR
jgi:hypothetical protein